jgi:hypothetical protein
MPLGVPQNGRSRRSICARVTGLDPRIVPNPAGAVILLTTTERGKDLQKTFPYHPRSKSFWKYGRLSSRTREQGGAAFFGRT